MYKHKTTKEEWENIKQNTLNNVSKRLHEVYVNETGNNIPLIKFQQLLQTWLMMLQMTSYEAGTKKINNYLDKIFV